MDYDGNRNDVLSSFFEVLIAKKALIIIGMVSVILTTVVGVFLMPSAYKATTKIIINPPPIPKGDLPYLSDLRNSMTFLSNQRELIRSKKIYEKVVTDFRLFETVGPPSIYKKAKKLFLRVDSLPYEDALDYLYSTTSVDIIRGTNIIQITAFANSSVQSAEIANAIAGTYIKYINNMFSDKTQSAYNYVQAELQAAQDNLQVARAALNTFTGSEKVSTPSSIESELAEVTKKLHEYEIQYENILEEIQFLENNKMSTTTTPDVEAMDDEKISSPQILQLKIELTKAQNELQSALLKNTENHPSVRRARDQVGKIESEITRQEELLRKGGAKLGNERIKKTGVETTRQLTPQQRLVEIKYRRDNLSNKINIAKSNRNKLLINLSKIVKLTQEVNSREREYLMQRERLDSSRILKTSEIEKEGSIKVIDQATPPGSPDSKKKLVLLGVGFMASILFGLGMAFIAEFLDDTLKSREEAERYLKLPILGTIPTLTKKVREI